MRKRLANQFLSGYIFLLLLTLAATALAFFLLSFSSGLIAGALAKNRYPASSIIRDDYTQIDASPVVQSGGGVQIVDSEYRVTASWGLDTIGKPQLDAGEFTAFLTESTKQPYHYDIVYHPEGKFWLIVTFPTSVRLDFAIVSNRRAASGDFARTAGVIAAVGGIYLLLIAGMTFLYARITAAGITRPLRKLCDGTKLLREGDYSARVDLRLKNEFAELQDTFNDMAARIEREVALLEKSEQDRKRLILDISHDLKNPLSSISGYAELCLKQPEPSAAQRAEYLETIRRGSRRANLLLSDLFELSRLDSPHFCLHPEKTDLCEYLRQSCGELLPLLEQAGFGYAFDIPETALYALLNQDRFGRVLQNLADNAVRHNPKGTSVRVSLSRQDGGAVILFSDDGVGIPAHLTEDIFKPFVRADESRGSETGGSGLGLSIARKLAEAHGGSLILRADTDRGCTFVITLPLI